MFIRLPVFVFAENRVANGLYDFVVEALDTGDLFAPKSEPLTAAQLNEVRRELAARNQTIDPTDWTRVGNVGV